MDKTRLIAKLQETNFRSFAIALGLTEDEIVFLARKRAGLSGDSVNLLGLKAEEVGNLWVHSIRRTPLNAFVLRYSLPKNTALGPDAARELRAMADKVPLPQATLEEDGKFVDVVTPKLKVYREFMSRLGAYANDNGFRLRVDKLIEFEQGLQAWKSKLPAIHMARNVEELTNAPIIGFDGSIDSLKRIPIGSLSMVQSNIQSRKALKNSKDDLSSKLTKLGVSSLHDLLFRLPRKYIDKSRPQLIDDLIPGEKATVIGKIVSLTELQAKVPGLRIVIKDETDTSMAVTFWRQTWLKSKFRPGDAVMLNGTVSLWNNSKQLGGDSIEHFDEGVTMPVVPIYRQSGTAGLTSAFFVSAMKELLKRMGELSLPVYFVNRERTGMKEILEQLHFPSNLEEHEKAFLAMAYYELVYMQLIIQHERDSITGKPGIALQAGERRLQRKAVDALPYELTPAQVSATQKLNKAFHSPIPSSTLLLADVGSGKTLAAQLAALRAVDAGRQAVFASPTDVLARQIYTSTEKLLRLLQEATGEEVTLRLLAGTMKAAERKAVLKELEDGTIDILVGTQAVFSDSVKYHDLGLVVIDEQQKFGAEQRTKLLEARGDGRVPHLLMQTATPIPRTTAQIYYGDIDVVTMDGKPPGRTPIETFWTQENPVDMLGDPSHPVWYDVANEAAKGNQTFVIAPLVTESAKIDAASVERAYNELSGSTLKNLRIGFVHGGMKADAQQETMARFRARELDILVASTVIEVGVDIPDATRVVILSADRLGASQLHQIRGRVGRSSKASKCYLVSLGATEGSQRRLEALVESEDGFSIARADLDIRGEGTMFSTGQSGGSDMIFAKLAQHSGLIEEAKEEAKRILRSPFQGLALRDAKAKYVSSERLF